MENLVAVYATRADAGRVRDRLVECGVPPTIALSPDTGVEPMPAQHEKNHSWWDWLFGSDVSDSDRHLYRGTLDRERTAVSVHLANGSDRANLERLMHDEGALDISGNEPVAMEGQAPPPVTPPRATASPAPEAGESHIPLAKEELVVGKQQTERRVHVRVYPVSRPVEESVRLRDERVVVERRPLSGDEVGDARLPPRDVEIIERHEEPVASKRTTATEEVVLRKDVEERTEKVRDTVKETKVDVDPREVERK